MEQVSRFYPEHPEFGVPYGYIRFRSLTCQGPNCGLTIPATSKFILDSRNLVGVMAEQSGDGFNLVVCKADTKDDFPEPTMRAGAVTCPSCGYTTPRVEVMKQREKYKLQSKLAAVVYKVNGTIVLESPTEEQVVADLKAVEDVQNTDYLIPNDEWPDTELRRFSPPLYGYSKFSDCHTYRQQVYLGNLAKLISSISSAPARRFAALLLARTVDANTSFCRWRNDRGGSVENTFAGKSIGMIWDFFESNPCHSDNGIWTDIQKLVTNIRSAKGHLQTQATVLPGAAQEIALPDDSVDVIYTDPPYYDSVPYSHLSDWPFVWVKQTGVFGSEKIDMGLVDKDREIVVDRPHSKSSSTHDEDYFRAEIKKAFQECRRILKPDGVAVVVFAHLNTTAWEALLESLVSSGFRVTASWPVETERGGRLQAQGTASLQSSIHLICRPRENPDGSLKQTVGEWRDVLSELPSRIASWLPRLASEGIVGADAIFACIGPALEIFSRFARVEKSTGEDVSLREYLEQVWSAVATEALSMIFTDANASGLEPDARLTAMWLWTLGNARSRKDSSNRLVAGIDETENRISSDADNKTATKNKSGYFLEFDAARKIAQGLGIHLEDCGSIVEMSGSIAKLIPIQKRSQILFEDPNSDNNSSDSRNQQTQGLLFNEMNQSADAHYAELNPRSNGTVLDRVHQAMILFSAGRGEALRRFLVDDGNGSDARFWSLAQSLSALYPLETDEKRCVDGLLARKKGLGL